MGSAEGSIGWLPGYDDAGGQLQKLWFLPACEDARMLPITGGLLRALWGMLCSHYQNVALVFTIPCAFPLIFPLQV